MTIELTDHRWHVDVDAEPLGTGGSATVYPGYAVTPDGEPDTDRPVAIKLMHANTNADRELDMSDLLKASRFENVVPIEDTGDVGGRPAFVMPRAETSLRDHLKTHRPTSADVLAILTDVAVALADLNGAVVHRDIKPENILLLEGRWQVADFGVSRISDAATSEHTRRRARTPEYASPEQWQGTRTNEATDIYSLGVVAFELFEGQRPFLGTDDELEEQHLETTPPVASSAPPSIQALILQCLAKKPTARPTAAQLLERLRRPEPAASTNALDLLERADLANVTRRAEAEAQAARDEAARQQLRDRQAAGLELFDILQSYVFDSIASRATTATFKDQLEYVQVTLHEGSLTMSTPLDCDIDNGHFHVAATSTITVEQRRTLTHTSSRSHSLWYCDAFEPGVYDWYELAFTPANPVRQRNDIPYARDPYATTSVFDGRTASADQLNGPMVRLDTTHPASFGDIWIERLANAAQGAIVSTSAVPEATDDRRWRKR